MLWWEGSWFPALKFSPVLLALVSSCIFKLESFKLTHLLRYCVWEKSTADFCFSLSNGSFGSMLSFLSHRLGRWNFCIFSWGISYYIQVTQLAVIFQHCYWYPLHREAWRNLASCLLLLSNMFYSNLSFSFLLNPNKIKVFTVPSWQDLYFSSWREGILIFILFYCIRLAQVVLDCSRLKATNQTSPIPCSPLKKKKKCLKNRT